MGAGQIRGTGIHKPRVVILGGAGAMGKITAGDLARTGRGAVQVVVADRDPASARELGVETVETDVLDPASLRRALHGAFAAIASLPYRFNLSAMEGALASGAHYVDLGGLFHMTRRQLELAPAFERAGLMAVLGMGSAPGILNLLAVLAARGLETVREVHCLVGAVDRTRFQSSPPLGFGYSADTLLDEFTMPSAVFRNGQFEFVAPLDPKERLAVRFPAPIGRLFVDTTLHSEVATLPPHFAGRGIREVTFRQAFDPQFVEKLGFLVRLGLVDTAPLRLRANGKTEAAIHGNTGTDAEVSPRRVLQALLARFPVAIPAGEPARYEVLRALVRGSEAGREVTVTADCHAGPAAGPGIGPDLDTGAPPSIAVQLLLSGEIPLRPGVWGPEDVVPVEPFVRELERRGMPVRRRRRTSLR